MLADEHTVFNSIYSQNIEIIYVYMKQDKDDIQKCADNWQITYQSYKAFGNNYLQQKKSNHLSLTFKDIVIVEFPTINILQVTIELGQAAKFCDCNS